LSTIAELASVLSPGQALLVAAVALFASTVTAIAGVGGAIVLSFVLAPILGVGALVQTISVAMIVNNLTKISVYATGIDWRTCAFITASAAPGCLIGSLIYSRLDEATITIVLGAFLVLIVAAKRFMPTEFRAWSRPAVAASAFVYGALTGTTIGGGILLLPILMGTGLTGMALIGTDAAVGFAMHIVKTLVFGSTRVLTPHYAAIGIVIGAVMIPGAFIARAILRRMPLKVHETIIDTVIIAGGLSFLLRAI